MSGIQYCELHNGNGTDCVSDGHGRHGNNERCVIAANKGLYLTATYFEVENYFDRLTINGTRYTGYNAPINVPMSAGMTMTW